MIFNLLDSNRDGFLNFRDKIIYETRDVLDVKLWYLELVLLIGIPSDWIIWAIIKNQPGVNKELFFNTVVKKT